MTGLAARSVTLLALAALLLAVTASSGSAASPSPHRGRILGVVPHSVAPAVAQPFSRSQAVRAAGPATLTFDPSYQTVINQYFTDVALDSGGSNNVYSVATQYFDNPGAVHIQYQSAFGRSHSTALRYWSGDRPNASASTSRPSLSPRSS